MRLLDLVKGKNGNLGVQMFRYLVTGWTAFIADVGLLTLLTECFGRDLLLLWTGIAFSTGIIITYVLSVRWVFDNRNVDNRAAEFGIFTLICIVGLGLTELLMWLFAEKAGLHYLPSKGITAGIVFLWNFVAKKFILFRNK